MSRTLDNPSYTPPEHRYLWRSTVVGLSLICLALINSGCVQSKSELRQVALDARHAAATAVANIHGHRPQPGEVGDIEVGGALLQVTFTGEVVEAHGEEVALLDIKSLPESVVAAPVAAPTQVPAAGAPAPAQKALCDTTLVVNVDDKSKIANIDTNEVKRQQCDMGLTSGTINITVLDDGNPSQGLTASFPTRTGLVAEIVLYCDANNEFPLDNFEDRNRSAYKLRGVPKCNEVMIHEGLHANRDLTGKDTGNRSIEETVAVQYEQINKGKYKIVVPGK